MSEEGAAPSNPNADSAARAQLVTRLQRLWQSDPANYWTEFKASGLEAKDVWENAFDYGESDTSKKGYGKPPGKK